MGGAWHDQEGPEANRPRDPAQGPLLRYTGQATEARMGCLHSRKVEEHIQSPTIDGAVTSYCAMSDRQTCRFRFGTSGGGEGGTLI